MGTLEELISKEDSSPIVHWDLAKPKTRCPKCGAGLERKHDYCWGCGQHIDWRDHNADGIGGNKEYEN